VESKSIKVSYEKLFCFAQSTHMKSIEQILAGIGLTKHSQDSKSKKELECRCAHAMIVHDEENLLVKSFTHFSTKRRKQHASS
jgi:hypothetical protein